LVLGELGGRTGDQAFASGVSARDVWFALCAAKDVPRSRWNSAGKPAPRMADWTARHAEPPPRRYVRVL